MTHFAINIGSKLELFVDDYLIDRLAGATRIMNKPLPQNVVMEFDKPWEGNCCSYVSVIKDGDTYRMYYRAAQVDYTHGDMTMRHKAAAYAESKDDRRCFRRNRRRCAGLSLPRVWSGHI